MCRLILRFLEKYGIHKVWILPHLWDISELVLPHMHPLGGYATSQHGDGMHEFRLKKDEAGVVRLHMRKSSKSSVWIPEGPGYAVFNSPPPRELKPAPFKDDSKWSRARVEATIRQWFPFMSLSNVELSTAQKEWTDCCFSLPADMQPSSLAPDQMLVAPELPTKVWEERAKKARHKVQNPSARLENPVVDPKYGHGRI